MDSVTTQADALAYAFQEFGRNAARINPDILRASTGRTVRDTPPPEPPTKDRKLDASPIDLTAAPVRARRPRVIDNL